MSSALCNLLKYAGIAKETVEKNAEYCKDYLSAKFNVGSIKNFKGQFIKKDTILQPGDSVVLVADCGTIKPYKYKVLISVNPELYKDGMVSAPSLLEEGDEDLVRIGFTVQEEMYVSDLKEKYDHLVRISVID